MRVLVQRCLEASCVVDNKTIGSIDRGLVLFVGFTAGDTIENINYLVKKIVNLRIFDDSDGVMNQSILEQDNYKILSISQFTLYADTKKGNRPSYINALGGNEAIELYDLFNQELSKYISVETGKFGADMKIHLVNDGPVTILIESR